MQHADWLTDLAERLIYAHQIDVGLISRALNVPDLVTDERHFTAGVLVDDIDPERLSLVVNVIVRLEIRLSGDSRAMRDALTTPLDVLCGITPAAMMTGSLGDLRQVRLAIDHITAPQERWWRKGHR